MGIFRTHKRPVAGIYIYRHMKVMVYINGIWKHCLFKWIFRKYVRIYMKVMGFAGIYIWRWWFRILRHQSWFSYSGWKKWKLPFLESIFHEMKKGRFFCENSIKVLFFSGNTREYYTKLIHCWLRDRWQYSNGWFFGKVPKGGRGSFLIENTYIADFGLLCTGL